MIKKNSFKLAFIYLGTILGAGFASGKELVSFFAKFEKIGIFSFLLACFLLALSLIAILDLIKNSNSADYKEFLSEVFGKKIAIFLEILNTVFLFAIFSAMLAGGGAVLGEILGLNSKICTIIFSFIIFFSSFFGEKAIVSINSILCPMLILGGAFIGIYIYFFSVTDVFNSFYKGGISAFVYTSYNIITTISVLFGVRKLILNKRVTIYSGILGGIFIFLIGVFLVLALIENYSLIKYEPLPILHIIQNESFIKFIYTAIILMAIYTTAISNEFALENIAYDKFKKNRFLLKIIIFLGAILLSFLGFSNMIEKVYPIFGYLGLFQLIVIFIIWVLKNLGIYQVVDKVYNLSKK